MVLLFKGNTLITIHYHITPMDDAHIILKGFSNGYA